MYIFWTHESYDINVGLPEEQKVDEQQHYSQQTHESCNCNLEPDKLQQTSNVPRWLPSAVAKQTTIL